MRQNWQVGVTEIRILPITTASSYPLIDLRSIEKEDGNPRRRVDVEATIHHGG